MSLILVEIHELAVCYLTHFRNLDSENFVVIIGYKKPRIFLSLVSLFNRNQLDELFGGELLQQIDAYISPTQHRSLASELG